MQESFSLNWNRSFKILMSKGGQFEINFWDNVRGAIEFWNFTVAIFSSYKNSYGLLRQFNKYQRKCFIFFQLFNSDICLHQNWRQILNFELEYLLIKDKSCVLSIFCMKAKKLITLIWIISWMEFGHLQKLHKFAQTIVKA